MKKIPLFNRLVALALAVIIPCSELAWATPSLSPQPHPFIHPVSIPSHLGTVEGSFTGTSGKTVIYIQDAHDSLEARKNIARLAQYGVRRYGVKTVFGERSMRISIALVQVEGRRRKVEGEKTKCLFSSTVHLQPSTFRLISNSPAPTISDSIWKMCWDIARSFLSGLLDRFFATDAIISRAASPALLKITFFIPRGYGILKDNKK